MCFFLHLLEGDPRYILVLHSSESPYILKTSKTGSELNVQWVRPRKSETKWWAELEETAHWTHWACVAATTMTANRTSMSSWHWKKNRAYNESHLYSCIHFHAEIILGYYNYVYTCFGRANSLTAGSNSEDTVQYRPVMAEGLAVASLSLFRPKALLDVLRDKGFSPPGNGRGTFRR